jgi:hypothetical protein
MLKKIGLGLLVVIALLAGVIALRPAEFRIARERTVSAPPAVVHRYVSDFHNWPQWSPWEKLDPQMKREHSGAAAGTGAVYSWSGNDQVGEGRMTITDSREPSSVTIRLEFLKPIEATNTTQFDFAPSGSGTRVTWAMTGHNNFLSKAFDLFVGMDKVVGADFEKGLAALDAATASAASAEPADSGSPAAPEAPRP